APAPRGAAGPRPRPAPPDPRRADQGPRLRLPRHGRRRIRDPDPPLAPGRPARRRPGRATVPGAVPQARGPLGPEQRPRPASRGRRPPGADPPALRRGRQPRRLRRAAPPPRRRPPGGALRFEGAYEKIEEERDWIWSSTSGGRESDGRRD